MRQFVESRPGSILHLESRARRACLRYRAQEMPPGTRPDRADVGFEVGPQGHARLLVARGTSYIGAEREVGEWIEAGVREFPDFPALERWIQGPLRRAFAVGREGGDADAEDALEAAPITDLPAVLRGLREAEAAGPLYLDDEELYEQLTRRILGQDGAMRSLAAATARHCARVQPRRPAVLFAVGPSGVGKTCSAETLARLLRDQGGANRGYRYLRLDMTEYQEAHRVSQLIGSPQGYVGHGEGSQLLDALRAQAKTVVLFDEIEKAHPAILRVLMNAMDAGRLSSPSSRGSEGHEVDCRHAIFLFTSNLDARGILDDLDSREGFGDPSAEDEVCRARLQAKGVAPEIVGRIGRFLVFRPLSPETRAEIMAATVREVAGEYGLSVAWVAPDVVVELMARTGGFSSQDFGTRPGQHLIDEALGGLFAAAAREFRQTPVRLCGPPFRCVPADDGPGERTE